MELYSSSLERLGPDIWLSGVFFDIHAVIFLDFIWGREIGFEFRSVSSDSADSCSGLDICRTSLWPVTFGKFGAGNSVTGCLFCSIRRAKLAGPHHLSADAPRPEIDGGDRFVSATNDVIAWNWAVRGAIVLFVAGMALIGGFRYRSNPAGPRESSKYAIWNQYVAISDRWRVSPAYIIFVFVFSLSMFLLSG